MEIIHAQDFGSQFDVAIVASRFNYEITNALWEGAIERLKELSFEDKNITTVWVPGAVEIPLTAKRLAKSNKYKAIICLGAVIRGETSHYDYVCNVVSDGLQQVSLECDLPMIFGVLTTENTQQARDRIGGKKGHKGREAADAAFEMVSILRQIDGERG